MKNQIATTFLITLLFAIHTNAQGLFLKIGGTGVGGSLIIQGDVVTPANHANEILINSYQEGTGAGCTLTGDCSPATQSELVVTTMLDKSFMPLRQALLNHTIFNLKVSQVATEVDNLIINLDDAMITGISLSSGGDNPSISISISSPKWQHKYIPTNTTYGWNFLTNTTYVHP